MGWSPVVCDLSELRDLYHESVVEFISGNPDAQKPIWSRGEDVTLANPLGPPVRGFEQVSRVMDAAAELISEGEGYTFDPIAVVETADLAYEVGIDRNRVRLAGTAEKVPISLRVTTIFRREGGDWLIVHRHADPITDARTIDSVVPPPTARR
jgi:ketosteroid isomerase-like protein